MNEVSSVCTNVLLIAIAILLCTVNELLALITYSHYHVPYYSVSCPSALKYATLEKLSRNGSYGLSRSVQFGAIPEAASVITYSSIPVKPCSGHGRCLTLRDAGIEFNGM